MTATSDQVALGFRAAGIPDTLVDEAIESFSETRRRFHLDDFRPGAVEGGRFTEAVLRILEWATTASFTPLGDPGFKADRIINTLAQSPVGTHPDSIRLHIPRALRLIYDIRNKRNTAHLGDGISPNIQDSSLIVNTMSWVLAELVRLYHAVTPAEAQELIDGLVEREVPMIQVFDGRPRILRNLRAGDHCLVLLYWANRTLPTSELIGWLPKPMRTNARRTLSSLHEKHFAHYEGETVKITRLGQREVERRSLITPL